MQGFGHGQFFAAGHDRGLYVAQRLAMDCPEAVRRLAVLDGIPIGEALARCDAKFAARWYHWFFFGQTGRPAERFINADPDAWYTATPEQMGDEAYADYRNAIHDPQTVHAMMEDYRAGLGIDRANDEADRSAEPGSAAPSFCCGLPGTTSKNCTPIRSQYGGTGPTICAADPSTADTTSPRKPPAELAAELTAFFAEDHLDDQG